MTPDWLYKHSTITTPYAVYPKYLEIFAGGKNHEYTIQAELIAPNILTATDSVAVKLTVAMETILADSNDHDPVFGICNGISFVGFNIMDQTNYVDHTPCLYVTGFGKTDHNVTFCVSRNTVLKHGSRCGSPVLHYSHARFAVQVEQTYSYCFIADSAVQYSLLVFEIVFLQVL